MESLLVRIAKERFTHPTSQIVHFVENDEANSILNDLEKYPHAYVLACLMDRQIKAERAWAIPYSIFKELNSFSLNDLSMVDLADLKRIFNTNRLHRFNDTMASVFHDAVLQIKNRYAGNAAKIWNNNPSSSAVVYKFLEFKGSGIKISTMAANILARQFRIPFSDHYSIDISPDVHIIRVMKRMGFVPADANNDMVIYKARELNPEFPGIIDFSCWEIGRKWCRPRMPNCSDCIVTTECKKELSV
jgi:endonuclease III